MVKCDYFVKQHQVQIPEILLFFIGQIQLWFAVFDVIIGEIAHQTTGEGRHVVHHRAFILLDDFPDSVTWMSNLHDRF